MSTLREEGGRKGGKERRREGGILCLTEMSVVPSGCAVKDYGNLTFEEVADDEPVGQVKRVRAVGGANQRLSEAVRAVKKDGHTSVMLGGDHR